MSKYLYGWRRIESLFKTIASVFGSRTDNANCASPSKYSSFTTGVRQVMRLANEEAMRSNHQYIGTQHILLGLVQEEAGIIAKILKGHGANANKIRQEAEKIAASGTEVATMNALPRTPTMKAIVDYALDLARNLNHNHAGTEHLLLGLVREKEGVATQILINLGLNLEDLREEVLKAIEMS